MFVCVFLFFFIFNNPISSSVCKLPLRSEIYNCTFINTNKVSIIIIIIIIIMFRCDRLYCVHTTTTAGKLLGKHFKLILTRI